LGISIFSSSLLFALRLGTKHNIFSYACISRSLSSSSATRIVHDNSDLFLLLFVSRYDWWLINSVVAVMVKIQTILHSNGSFIQDYETNHTAQATMLKERCWTIEIRTMSWVPNFVAVMISSRHSLYEILLHLKMLGFSTMVTVTVLYFMRIHWTICSCVVRLWADEPRHQISMAIKHWLQ
jgi:hypothetical protein